MILNLEDIPAASAPRKASELIIEELPACSKSPMPDQDVMELDLEQPASRMEVSSNQPNNVQPGELKVEKIVGEELWKGEMHIYV